jgi:hypothetical protein
MHQLEAPAAFSIRSNDPARIWNSEFADRRTIAQTKTQ